MVDLQPFRFKLERVPNPEDSGNEEVNDRLDGTFWCTCERCENPWRNHANAKRMCLLPKTGRGRNKMAGKIFSQYTALVAVNGKTIFLCKLH